MAEAISVDGLSIKGSRMTIITADTHEEQHRPLTVKDLIEALAQYPLDVRVVVDGYEDGYDNLHVDSLRAVSIQPRPGHAEWEGENEEAWLNPGANEFSAVCIARKSR
jgi:DUF1365 family protein